MSEHCDRSTNCGLQVVRITLRLVCLLWTDFHEQKDGKVYRNLILNLKMLCLLTKKFLIDSYRPCKMSIDLLISNAKASSPWAMTNLTRNLLKRLSKLKKKLFVTFLMHFKSTGSRMVSMV